RTMKSGAVPRSDRPSATVWATTTSTPMPAKTRRNNSHAATSSSTTSIRSPSIAGPPCQGTGQVIMNLRWVARWKYGCTFARFNGPRRVGLIRPGRSHLTGPEHAGQVDRLLQERIGPEACDLPERGRVVGGHHRDAGRQVLRPNPSQDPGAESV